MDEEKNIKDLYFENQKSLFLNHFVGVNPNMATDKICKDAIILLVNAQIYFSLIQDCLRIIKEDKNYYKSLSKNDKNTMNANIKTFGKTSRDIENIIKRFISKLKSDDNNFRRTIKS